MGDNSALAAKFEEVLRENDFGKMIEVTKEHSTDDFYTDWPQSGERIVGRQGVMNLMERYAQATGTAPKMTIRTIQGADDLYVVEGTIDYGDGIPVSYVGIAEFAEGKVRRMT